MRKTIECEGKYLSWNLSKQINIFELIAFINVSSNIVEFGVKYGVVCGVVWGYWKSGQP